jgi:hypothetical protein
VFPQQLRQLGDIAAIRRAAVFIFGAALEWSSISGATVRSIFRFANFLAREPRSQIF